MTMHRISVSTRVTMLPFRERSLRHERPQPRVVGFVREVPELLVGDDQLLSKLLQPLTDVRETTFQKAPRHHSKCTFRHVVPVSPSNGRTGTLAAGARREVAGTGTERKAPAKNSPRLLLTRGLCRPVMLLLSASSMHPRPRRRPPACPLGRRAARHWQISLDLRSRSGHGRRTDRPPLARLAELFERLSARPLDSLRLARSARVLAWADSSPPCWSRCS